MKSHINEKDSSLENKSEKDLQSKIIRGNSLITELEVKGEAQSKNKQEKNIQNNLDVKDNSNRGVAQNLGNIENSAEINDKKESDEKIPNINNNKKDAKEKGKMQLNSKGNSSLEIHKIESWPLEKKEKKVKKKKSQKEIKKDKICLKETEKEKIWEKEIYLNNNFENLELIEIIKGFKNKTNQKYTNNVNIKHIYPESFENFKFEIMNNFIFIPQIDNNDDGDKLKSENGEIFNISSNHSRYNRTLNFLNEDLTNNAVIYHPPFTYHYPTTNYITNI